MPSAPFRLNASKLAEVRFRAGLTQSGLAHRLGVNRNYVWRIETGEFSPSPARLRDIATALGCTLDDIVERVAA